MIIRRDSFPNSTITMQYESPYLDVPMNTKGQIKGSSNVSALVAISGIGPPRKQVMAESLTPKNKDRERSVTKSE